MDHHRQHTLSIPPTLVAHDEIGDKDRPLRGAIYVLAGAALMVAVAFFGAYWFNGGARSTPIATASDIPTAPLAPVSAQARALQSRLEDWRSGYEAAVENGCQLRPFLGSPLGGRK